MSKKGTCTNIEVCAKAVRREIFTVEEGADFVCPVCKSQLQEHVEKVVVPKSNPNPVTVMLFTLLGVFVLVILVAGGWLGYDYVKNKDAGTSIIQTYLPALFEVKEKKDTFGSGKLELGDGQYVGDYKNGRPHGHGKLTYTKLVLLNPDADDNKRQYAEPNEYVVGEWHEGRLNYGKLYTSSGVLIRSLNIGVAR